MTDEKNDNQIEEGKDRPNEPKTGEKKTGMSFDASGAPVQADVRTGGGDRGRDSRFGGRPGGRGGFRRDGRPGGRRGGRGEEAKDEYEQKIIDIARVTRVMAGGKRMRFRACVAIGNRQGRVGIGIAKGADVSVAVTKAVNKAKKNLIKVNIVNDTIPHEVRIKFGAAKILFKPAREGRGVIAGGAVRSVIELAGIKNIVSKILGTNNKVNNVKGAIEALKSLKIREGAKDAAKPLEQPAVVDKK